MRMVVRCGSIRGLKLHGAAKDRAMMHMFTFSIFWFLLPFMLVGLIGRLFGHARRRLASTSRDGASLPEIARLRVATIEPTVYRLAKRLAGRITVSDVVIETGLSANDAEQLLQSMTDSVRVRMDVDDRGIVTYEFTELLDSTFSHS
jgi:hypothetical protein